MYIVSGCAYPDYLKIAETKVADGIDTIDCTFRRYTYCVCTVRLFTPDVLPTI